MASKTPRKSGTKTRDVGKQQAPPRTVISPETRRVLARIAACARARSTLAKNPARFGAVLPFLVYRTPPVPAAMPAALFRRLDPWRAPDESPRGVADADANGIPESSIDLRLLDGRSARLVRRVRLRRSSVFREIFLEDRSGRRTWDLPIGLLPLHGIDAVSKSQPLIVTEGVRAAENLKSHGLNAVGTLTGPLFLHALAALDPIVKGRTAVLWPLPDERGIAHMQQVAAQLVHLRAGAVKMIFGRQDPTAPLDAQTTIERIIGWATDWRPSLWALPARERLPASGMRASQLGIPPGASRSDERLMPAVSPFRRAVAMRHVMALRSYVAKVIGGSELDPAERDGFSEHMNALLAQFGGSPPDEPESRER